MDDIPQSPASGNSNTNSKRRRRVSDNLLNYERSGGKTLSQMYLNQQKASGDSIFTKSSFNGDLLEGKEEEEKGKKEEIIAICYNDLINPQLKADYSLDLNHLEV